jgi:hypothetical protein
LVVAAVAALDLLLPDRILIIPVHHRSTNNIICLSMDITTVAVLPLQR